MVTGRPNGPEVVVTTQEIGPAILLGPVVGLVVGFGLTFLLESTFASIAAGVAVGVVALRVAVRARASKGPNFPQNMAEFERQYG